MNSKKAGVVFLLLIVLHALVNALVILHYSWNPTAKEMSMITNLLLSELVIVLPTLLVVFSSKGRKPLRSIFGFRKIKISTALMTVLFTILIMPLATFFNAISMLFVENTVANIAGDILDVPFFHMFFLIAVYGPFCEELVFRGAIYRGFRKTGNIFGAILLSGLCFGLMHMNFNQAGYAFALGIMMALLAEATGSTTASFLCHLIFNGETVCMMFLEKALYSQDALEGLLDVSLGKEELMASISMLLVVALIGTALALCVLAWIAQNEGKQNFYRTIWQSRGLRREVLWTVPVISGILLAVGIMTWEFLYIR